MQNALTNAVFQHATGYGFLSALPPPSAGAGVLAPGVAGGVVVASDGAGGGVSDGGLGVPASLAA